MIQPAAEAVRRFAADLDALVDADATLGLAVSGGPDSVALLLLASAARPGQVEAATVDHGLRSQSAAEAEAVAHLCRSIGVPHVTLRPDWEAPPTANIQAAARTMRYRLLDQWAADRRLDAVATAHHADDQAETLLMRLARGSGLAGLAGVRRSRANALGATLVRPLLDWRKADLVGIVDAAGIAVADDPSNRDPAFERTRARDLLSKAGWIDSGRMASSAAALADAEEALAWTANRLADERIRTDGDVLSIDISDIPHELARRLLLIAFARLGATPPRGPDLERAIAALREGRSASLSGLVLRPGARWTASREPARRH